MADYILKSDIVAEIKRRMDENRGKQSLPQYFGMIEEDLNILSFLDTLEVKEVIEYEQPEYSCFETTYKCGKKPHWNVGDILAYQFFYSDREGEHILGKVTEVEFDEEQCDWLYTFEDEDGNMSYEETLIENQTYKRN